ncbi:hypothetical protein CROQUDRAFT_660774 [Cronartium quercuum f. sp. fusiforme G11]|uniref:A-kinase anchor protein 7-like phosphoesterase domain-containing protein n=1 Tax=Cronartium quercuum f. sp. fusiforme G11 TaxID=708437 RepID=A0A9P6T9P3_9BASI|nr:hypothetical protein CROQUDRAFT_660774 [Cronartium quercuum f. sp. fusiforme G11]
MVRSAGTIARTAPNYFISIPLSNHVELGQRTLALTNRLERFPGLEIIPTSRLHLTLGVCALYGKRQIDYALSILESCKQDLVQLLRDRPLRVQFNQIGTFPPTASQARVIYAAPHDIEQTPGLVIEVSELVRSRFSEAGLLRDGRPLQLHCTLAKILRQPPGGRSSIDARVLFDPVCRSAHALGSYQLDRIDLCKMGSTNTEGGGYYSEGGLDLV